MIYSVFGDIGRGERGGNGLRNGIGNGCLGREEWVWNMALSLSGETIYLLIYDLMHLWGHRKR